jgi:ectoine hydroxylase-related dioxygenase (phytanoyl-CoA dioxygenase family)
VNHTFEADGFCMMSKVFANSAVASLIAALERANVARSKRGEAVFGARNLLYVPEISDLARSSELASIVQTVLGDEAAPVRGIFFDKTPTANWPVAWHQDLTLAVAKRRDLSGWTNWSVKAGAHHVNPPSSVLESMMTLRVMLDDCDADNGPLRVLPGSHRLGRLSREQIVSLCASGPEHECLGSEGDVLMMRPLLLHASSAARNPRHRRVIHLEYAVKGIIPTELLN